MRMFKVCPNCRHTWDQRVEFLEDGAVDLVGYQANLKGEPNEGYFIFNHEDHNCHTTFALYVKDFIDMYQGEVFHESRTGEHDCSGACLAVTNLNHCNAPCKMAHIRKLMQTIKKSAA